MKSRGLACKEEFNSVAQHKSRLRKDNGNTVTPAYVEAQLQQCCLATLSHMSKLFFFSFRFLFFFFP